MSAEPITRLPDPRSIGRELSELARQCDDGSDPHVIAQVMLTRIHVRDRDVALAHMLAHEVVRARGTTRRQITGAVRRGTSRADIIAANAQRSSRSTR